MPHIPAIQQIQSKHQYCPTCNRYVKINENYQNYICGKCVTIAADKAGKLISFYNITEAGNGLQGKYRKKWCF